MNFNVTGIIYLIFFLSGAAALVFETLWFRLAELVFGNSIWGAALVLSGFMAGLALGNFLVARYGPSIKRPMSVYVALEVMIGFSGLILVLILPGLQEMLVPLYRPFLDHLVELNLVRLSVVFTLLLIPTMAMGATLPIMVKSLSGIDKSFGSVLGNLYGINTVGAVTGVLMCEFLLIKYLGIANTGKLAAFFNLGAALLALHVVPAMDQGHREPAGDNGQNPADFKLIAKNRELLLAAFLSGAVLLALEIIWFRFLLLFSFGTSKIFAIMLVSVLAGIGMGGLGASVFFRKKNNIVRYIKEISLCEGILVLATYISFNQIRAVLTILGVPDFSSFILLCVFLMFPVSFLSGILFTSIGNAIKQNNMTSTGAAGLLTLSNTLGAMCGALVAGFLLLPLLGMEKSFFLLALCYGVIALLVPVQYSSLRITGTILKPVFLVSAAYLCLLMFFPFGEMYRVFFRQIAHGYGATGISNVSEGTVATNIYLEYDYLGKPEFYRLVTNSHSMSATNILGRRYMKLFVYLPVALHPGIKDALLISYGHGSTAKALVDTASVKSIDVVDISRDVLKMSNVLYSDQDNPLHDARVRVHIEDGRFFLLTTPRQYDLITAEPPPPKGAGIVNLYSQQYFKLVYDRLNDGGIATYWLPTHGLFLSDTRSIIKAFCNVFSDCSLWNGSGLDWILMGTKNAAGPVSYEHFTAQWHTPGVALELKVLGFENAAQLGATFLADAQYLDEFTKNSLPVTDNFPLRISPDTEFNDASFSPYYHIMFEPDARYRFMHSKYIANIWPQSLRQETLGYFKYQKMINNKFMTDYRKSDEQPVADLHDVLTHTSLETLPLWLMNSDDVRQSIVQQLQSAHARVDAIPLQLALQAIAARDYPQAIRQIELYLETKSAENKTVIYSLYLYSLCVMGRIDEANNLLDKIISSFPYSPGNMRFISWFHDNFGLDIPKNYRQ